MHQCILPSSREHKLCKKQFSDALRKNKQTGPGHFAEKVDRNNEGVSSSPCEFQLGFLYRDHGTGLNFKSSCLILLGALSIRRWLDLVTGGGPYSPCRQRWVLEEAVEEDCPFCEEWWNPTQHEQPASSVRDLLKVPFRDPSEAGLSGQVIKLYPDAPNNPWSFKT